jgi:hypothetical protein
MNLVKMLWITLFVCCQLSFAQRIAVRKSPPAGQTTISVRFGKAKVKAIFRTSTLSNTEEKSRRLVQCTYSRVPCSLTEKIRLSFYGSEVFIPRSAYSDLGDISTAELTMSSGQMVLTVEGGDASESLHSEAYFWTGRTDRASAL